MKNLFAVALVLSGAIAGGIAVAQDKPTGRDAALVSNLQQQRNSALDAVATCYADANAELDKLRAKVAELEKAAPKSE